MNRTKREREMTLQEWALLHPKETKEALLNLGRKCPKCGGNMKRTLDSLLLLSGEKKYTLLCKSCGYRIR